jgi:hypothetical protein
MKQRRTKMQHGYFDSSLIKIITNNTNRNVKKTALSGANKHRDRNNQPQNTQRIWLPKYVSQSETTINTCL